MSHKLVKIKTDEDGVKQPPFWHFVVTVAGSEHSLCENQVFGEGEGTATFETKVVPRGGVTCPECKRIIKMFKAIRL